MKALTGVVLSPLHNAVVEIVDSGVSSSKKIFERLSAYELGATRNDMAWALVELQTRDLNRCHASNDGVIRRISKGHYGLRKT